MPLTIETFSNVKGGNSFYKAICHPIAARKAHSFLDMLSSSGPVAIYDPQGFYSGFEEFYDVSEINFVGSYVQDTARIGNLVAGLTAQPVTDLPDCAAPTLLIASFDSSKLQDHIAHLIPERCRVVSFDEFRLEDALLTNKRSYLDSRNFATNFAFLRDDLGARTRISTANYWSGYGAESVALHLILFSDDGGVLAEWDETLAEGASAVTIDSREIRQRFDLDNFTGQLFIHAIGVVGHDIVKYALDTWDDEGAELSSTHDANAWPSDLYAGLPAPKSDEEVVLWIQNSHPSPIPAGEIGLNLMGKDEVVYLDEPIPGFGTYRLAVNEFLSEAEWPQQIEVQAGKHFVRPRYEITSSNNARRIAHVNVERVDLKPDPGIPELGNLMGKGYILPGPILPSKTWQSVVLPTPMATCQNDLPIAALAIDASGQEIARHNFGRLPRDHETSLDIEQMLNGHGALPHGSGHIELIYDFADGGDADGWLHGIFRYENRETGHVAETSFGAHIFNTILTYKDEPQSYNGPPPGLSTRLFLRLGEDPLDTLCHLIYPASTPWHPVSETKLTLFGHDGSEIAAEKIAIPCGGSAHLRYHDIFSADDRRKASVGAYIVIRDTTCRLFGYHGLVAENGAFSLDHMFGF
ncbi:MAG: hypothetical protein CMM52_07915 [Rhodospirillaceae bacterium]|nr:hypothetical protein [Rhodospirillaceae bacterium]|tara:strand:- start:2170 stop:4080 length:1911 start_codon:yes stop_codon:yes gene_type:complete